MISQYATVCNERAIGNEVQLDACQQHIKTMIEAVVVVREQERKEIAEANDYQI